MFRPSTGLDLTRLSETEQLYFQVFEDVFEHGETPSGKVLGEMLRAGHLSTENDLLRITPDGLTLFEFLQEKAKPHARYGT